MYLQGRSPLPLLERSLVVQWEFANPNPQPSRPKIYERWVSDQPSHPKIHGRWDLSLTGSRDVPSGKEDSSLSVSKDRKSLSDACEGIWSFGSSTNSVSFGMEIRVVASLLTHCDNHCQDCLPTSLDKSTAGKSHVGARNVPPGRGDEESINWQRFQISLRCLWRHLIHCWIRYFNLFITSWNEGQNDCCVNASLVLFSPQSVLLISTFRIYITVITDVVRDSLRGTLADGRIFNGHTMLREWFQRKFNCRFQLCILLGRYRWVNSCLGFNLSLLLYRQSCWVTHYQYILVCCNLCSFSLTHLTR